MKRALYLLAIASFAILLFFFVQKKRNSIAITLAIPKGYAAASPLPSSSWESPLLEIEDAEKETTATEPSISKPKVKPAKRHPHRRSHKRLHKRRRFR